MKSAERTVTYVRCVKERTDSSNKNV